MYFTQVIALLRKEFLLEWRNKYALNGILLYLVSTIFIAYMSFRVKAGDLNPITWNVLFWIIVLFTTVNAVAKSFMEEKEGRLLYLYTVAAPNAVLMAKLLYNMVMAIGLALVGLLFYSLVMGNPVANMGLFSLNIVLTGLGFAGVLTLISGIAAKAGNNITLMAILSFPVILPELMMSLKVSKNAMDGLAWSVSLDEISILASVDMIAIAASFLLFPYLWRT